MRDAPCTAGARRRHLLFESIAEIEGLEAAGRLVRQVGAEEKRFCRCGWTLYRLDGVEVAVEVDVPAL